MLHKFVLKNGIQVVAYDMPSVRSFHVRISVKGGSLVETDLNNGVAHFMEHILVQGIPSFPTAEELSQFIESLAGNYNAYTSQLLVAFSITVPSLHASDAVKIASEVFFRPLFKDSDIERERHVVINEIKQDMDSRWYKFGEFFREKRFVKGSLLKLKTVGDPRIVSKVGREDLVIYWKKYFVPKNTYILVIGNLKDTNLQKLLESYFGDQKATKTFSGFGFHGNKDLSRRTVAIRHDTDLQVNYIDFTYPSLTMEEPLLLRIKENMAHVIFGGLSSSRLFRLLRHQKGLVYGVSSTHNRLPKVGYGSISSEVAPEHLEEVVRLIVAELRGFIDKGPTSDEVAFTKHYLSNGWLMSFDHPGSIASWIESELLWKSDNDTIFLPEEYIKLVEKITPKDVQEVMQKHWDFSKLNLLVQGPFENTRQNRDFLEDVLQPL